MLVPLKRATPVFRTSCVADNACPAYSCRRIFLTPGLEAENCFFPLFFVKAAEFAAAVLVVVVVAAAWLAEDCGGGGGGGSNNDQCRFGSSTDYISTFIK